MRPSEEIAKNTVEINSKLFIVGKRDYDLRVQYMDTDAHTEGLNLSVESVVEWTNNL